MDLYGMKRKDLQTLCKKHGIPRNLKNSEMSRRLVLVFEENNVEAVYGIKENNVVVSGETKKVRFSPETEVFEFTRSLKKSKRKKVQKPQQGGIAQKGTRRSKRIGCKLTGVMGVKQFQNEDTSKRLSENESVVKEVTSNQDGLKLEEVRRRSTRLTKSCVGGEISNAKRSKQLVDTKEKEDELVNVKDDDPQVKKIPRRSKRFVNAINVETNTQAQRRSTRLKASIAKPSIRG